MKKLKKSIVESKTKSIFKPEIKCSRITIDSRICNIDKFNLLFNSLDSTKDFKNIISQYCYDNLFSLVSDYHDFIKHYNQFKSNQLNSWERQNIFQEIAGVSNQSNKKT